MSFLLDTNVLSELRKGPRADARVRAWFADVHEADLFTSALVLGEVRRGVELVRRRDPMGAAALDQWHARLRETFADRILPVDDAVADAWGRLNVPDPLPSVDGLLAATALVHGMTLVTRNVRNVRNVRDVRGSGVAVLDPFAG